MVEPVETVEMDPKSRPLAMVTGAGRGLGLAVARGLARDGHRVLLAVRQPEQAHGALEAVRAGGGSAALVELDVTAQDAAERAAATCASMADRSRCS